VTFSDDLSDLKRCINSIDLQQEQVEIIIIDNLNSVVIRNFAKSRAGMSYYNLPNPGFGAGHNFASDKFQLNGHRIYLNPDIEMYPDCLAKIKLCFVENKDYVLLSPQLINLDGTRQKFIRNFPSILNIFKRIFGLEEDIKTNLFDKVYPVDYIHGAFLVLSEYVNPKIAKYDEDYFLYLEDFDLCHRISEFGKVGVVLQAFALHVHARSSRKSIKLKLIHLRSLLIFWKKFGLFRRR